LQHDGTKACLLQTAHQKQLTQEL